MQRRRRENVLAAALEANRELAGLADELRGENAGRGRNEEQTAELEKLRAELAVLQRMVFGDRRSGRARGRPRRGRRGSRGQR